MIDFLTLVTKTTFFVASSPQRVNPKITKKRKKGRKIRWKTMKFAKKDTKIPLWPLGCGKRKFWRSMKITGRRRLLTLPKRAESCSATTKERRKFWWQASVLGRTPNSEGRIRGRSDQTAKGTAKESGKGLEVENIGPRPLTAGAVVGGWALTAARDWGVGNGR